MELRHPLRGAFTSSAADESVMGNAIVTNECLLSLIRNDRNQAKEDLRYLEILLIIRPRTQSKAILLTLHVFAHAMCPYPDFVAAQYIMKTQRRRCWIEKKLHHCRPFSIWVCRAVPFQQDSRIFGSHLIQSLEFRLPPLFSLEPAWL